MSGTFHVVEPTVARLAGTFSERQQLPTDIGRPMRQGAGGVRTGDPALDAETQQLFEQYQQLLERIGEAFGFAAGALTDVVDSTRRFDAAKAAEHRHFTDETYG
jgi:hypothetical protein